MCSCLGKTDLFLSTNGFVVAMVTEWQAASRYYLREGDPGPQEADSGGDRCWWNKHKKKCTVLNFGKCYVKGVQSCVKAYTKERDGGEGARRGWEAQREARWEGTDRILDTMESETLKGPVFPENRSSYMT